MQTRRRIVLTTCSFVLLVVVIALTLGLYFGLKADKEPPQPPLDPPAVLGTVPAEEPWLFSTRYQAAQQAGVWSPSSEPFSPFDNVFPVLQFLGATQWRRQVDPDPNFYETFLEELPDGNFVDTNTPNVELSPPYIVDDQPGNAFPWCINVTYIYSFGDGKWSGSSPVFASTQNVFPVLTFHHAGLHSHVEWQRSSGSTDAFVPIELDRQGSVFIDRNNPCTSPATPFFAQAQRGGARPWCIETWYQFSLDDHTWSPSTPTGFQSNEAEYPVLTFIGADQADHVAWRRRTSEQNEFEVVSLQRQATVFVDLNNPCPTPTPRPYFNGDQQGQGPWCTPTMYELSVDGGATWSDPTESYFQTDLALVPSLTFENSELYGAVLWRRSLNLSSDFLPADMQRLGSNFIDIFNPCTVPRPAQPVVISTVAGNPNPAGWCLETRYMVSTGGEFSLPSDPFSSISPVFPQLTFAIPAGSPFIRWLRAVGDSDDFLPVSLTREGALFTDRSNPCPRTLQVVPEENVFWISQNEEETYSAVVEPGLYSLLGLLTSIQNNMRSSSGERLDGIRFFEGANGRLSVTASCIGRAPCWPRQDDQNSVPFRAIVATQTMSGAPTSQPNDMKTLNAFLGFYNLAAPAQYVHPSQLQAAPWPPVQ